MKKTTLRMDTLTVESFDTGDVRQAAGTAQALFATRPEICDPVTYHPRCPVA